VVGRRRAANAATDDDYVRDTCHFYRHSHVT
jgi:hypothetical protein